MPKYSDDEFLEAFTGDQLTTTHVIADRVGCTPETANRRLKALADEDEVEFIDPYPTYFKETSLELTVHRTGDDYDAIIPGSLR